MSDEKEQLMYTQGLIDNSVKYNYYIQNEYHYQQNKKKNGNYIIDPFKDDVVKYNLSCYKTGKT